MATDVFLTLKEETAPQLGLWCHFLYQEQLMKMKCTRRARLGCSPSLAGACTSNCSDLPGRIEFSQFLFFLLPAPPSRPSDFINTYIVLFLKEYYGF